MGYLLWCVFHFRHRLTAHSLIMVLKNKGAKRSYTLVFKVLIEDVTGRKRDVNEIPKGIMTGDALNGPYRFLLPISETATVTTVAFFCVKDCSLERRATASFACYRRSR